MLRATTACNLSSLIWPDGSAPAALASLLFDPPEPQIIGKTQCCFATFLPFRAAGPSFFWGFLFFDLLSPSPPLLFSSLLCSALLCSSLLFSSLTPVSAFYLLILSELWHLNFLRLFHRYLYATNSYYRYVPPFTAQDGTICRGSKEISGWNLGARWCHELWMGVEPCPLKGTTRSCDNYPISIRLLIVICTDGGFLNILN